MRPLRNWCRIFTACEAPCGTLRLPRKLVHITTPDGDFFSLSSKTFTPLKLRSLNRLLLSPRPPPKYVKLLLQPKRYPQPKIFDPLSGFFAHEYFKSRAILKKYHCSRKVLFFVLQKWRLLHTHTLKNRYEGVNPLKLPQSVQATLRA